ncbi:peptidase inhibitor family I36 protein [Streptomyces sp. NPDC047043]|uniref:peptidase inhibitor family I36 protein n=1 Tax=Streptomyces sp. NPDC047043 TaxID=3154497 RepID=UPI003403F875
MEGAARSRGAAAVPPQPQADYHGCPRGDIVRWYCFYENRDWNEIIAGRRLQWSDPHCDDFMDFADWSFAGKTSSWVNSGHLEVTVWDSSVHRIWTEAPNSLSAYVGAAHNDEARFFEACA